MTTRAPQNHGPRKGGVVDRHLGGFPAAESSIRRILRWVGQVLVLPLIGLIRVYQLVISPLTPPSCRYYPSCSAYALTSLRRFGPIKGTWLAARRLLRCHPWAAGGVDHVPERPRRPSHTAPSGQGLDSPESRESPDASGTPESPDTLATTGPEPASRATADSLPAGRPNPRNKGLS